MKHFTKKLVPYRMISSIFIALFFTFIIIVNCLPEEEGASVAIDERIVIGAIIAGLVIYVFLCIYHFLYYKTSYYQFEENGITCRRGVLFRKKSFLEYSRIHAVNKKQGLIQQLFKIGYLLVDSGSTNTSFNAEIAICEDSLVIDKLIEQIKEKQAIINNEKVDNLKKPDSEKVNLYHFTSKRKLIYSALNTVVMVIYFLFLAIVLSMVVGLILEFSEENISLVNVLLIGLLIYLGLCVFSFAISILSSFVAYYNFQVFRNEDDVEINYGLFVKNKNTFKLSRVRAIRVHRGLIKRIFGFASVSVEVIGYGEMNNNSNKSINNVLIPLCKLSEVNHYIEVIFKDYVPLERKHKAKNFIALCSWSLIFQGITFLVLSSLALTWGLFLKEYQITGYVILGIVVYFMIMAGLTFINALLKYRNEGISVKDDKVSVYHGGFVLVCTTILKKDIIGIEDVSTYFQRKKNISAYIIHFRSNAMQNRAYVEALDDEIKNQIVELLRM